MINVITEAASRTQGGRVELASGNEERGFAAIRYGDELGTLGPLPRLREVQLSGRRSVTAVGRERG